MKTTVKTRRTPEEMIAFLGLQIGRIVERRLADNDRIEAIKQHLLAIKAKMDEKVERDKAKEVIEVEVEKLKEAIRKLRGGK